MSAKQFHGARDITASMWMLWLTAFAGDFGREDEVLRQTRYVRLRGDGPVYGRWRNRNGAHLAWRFADGQIEHVDTYEGREHVRTVHYAADGRVRSTVDWETQVVVLPLAPPTTVAFGDWPTLEVAGLSLRGPGLRATGEDTWTAGGVAIALQPVAEPFSEGFGEEVRSSCACEVEARMTAWIAGHPAAHFRLQRGAKTADLVALPINDGLLVFAAAGSEMDALHPLRAMMAVAREAP